MPTLTAFSYRYTRWSAFHSHELSLATSAVTLSSAVLADALILFCLVYFLARSRLALDPYEGYVRVFSVYVANPGVFTSMFSVAALVMFLAYPSGYIWLGLVELQSKFYVYAFLTGLNDRARIWDGSTRSSRVSTWGFWRPTIPTGRATDTRIGTHIAETQIDEEMVRVVRLSRK
ncbi:hypothetical protein GLOTRDRAFT_129857 [Gloeophyllum trabeum ATCC 11539]|uniref:DUF6534 domain-containing protein n=1 Tax=Gloeophyllum trabeum (strain ATCC 11539 / FP-39264 / Madison 617) TaxID=670483 RepID=S7RNZ9_GLOTA|nr:uncharacterized protein GLOTRDRAFT_129857 [Gloeophyllum trabeum ATCC 11539]EPQ54494.1 hypothetical protein GLOTRDRAFT_129857 [Gloeophyllum trabeum ATCC 11539]